MANDVYTLHTIHPSESGVKKRLAGRFAVIGGKIHHLEDYHGHLKGVIPEGAVVGARSSRLEKLLAGHPYLQLRSYSRQMGGHYPDEVEEIPNSPQAKELVKKPDVWHYRRSGHDQDHLLEFSNGALLLNGHTLSPEEAQAVMENIRSGAASVKYPLEKSELKKMDPHDALVHLDSISGDEKTRAAVKALRQHIMTDPMTGLGNKYAYDRFSERKPSGVTVIGDANFFKQINDLYGHEVGDTAIKAIGGAWKDAASEVGEGKAHRFGGDEFHVHFPTQDHAAQFARNLRSKLEKIPAIKGTHRVSMSLGVGNDFASADKSLYEAKKQKLGHTSSTIPHVLLHGFRPSTPNPPAPPTAPVPGPKVQQSH